MDPFSVISAGINYFGQQQTNAMQAQMMQQQEAFQERMSSTAYQRASKDMMAAGLNPMMMFSSGSAASSPAGAAPSPMVKSGLDADAIQKSVSSAVQQKVANATIENLVAQNAKIKAETLTEDQRPALVSADTKLRRRQSETEANRADLLGAESMKSHYEVPIVRNRAVTSANEERMNPSARRIFDQGAYYGRKGADTLAPVTDIVNSAGKVKRLFMEDRWP